MKPVPADRPLSVWQSALLAHGCQLKSGEQLIPLELQPVGDHVVCTPTASGSMLPFDVRVTVGTPVTIKWDNDLSRYIVHGEGKPKAA